MADEKKIIFGIQDNASAKINQINQNSGKAGRDQISIQKEQVSLLEKQIKLLEKKIAIEKSAVEKFATGARAEAEYYSPAGKARVESQVEIEEATFEKFEKGIQEQVSILRQLKEDSKKNISVAQQTEQETKKENQRKAKYEDLRQARREVELDPKGIKKKIEQVEKEGYGTMTSSQIERMNYQKGILGQQKPDPNLYRTIVGAVLSTAAIRDVMSGVKGILTSGTGEQSINQLTTGVGQGMMGMGIASKNPYLAAGGAGVDLLGTLLTGTTASKYAVAPGLNRLNAMAGGGVGLGGRTGLGFSSQQSLGLQEGLLTAGGRSSGLSGLTTQAQILHRGLGLPEATLINMVKSARVIGSSTDLMRMTADILKQNPDLIEDQTRTAEIANAQLSIQNTLAQTNESVNPENISKIFGGLRSVGGRMSTDADYAKSVTEKLNQGLTNPGTAFQQARSYGVLSTLKPGGDLLDLEIMKSKGISQEGYLPAMLRQRLAEQGGNVRTTALSLATQEGLNPETALKLVEAYKKNPKLLEGKGGQQKIDEIIGKKRAEEYTARNTKEEAESQESNLMGVMSTVSTKFSHAINGLGDRVVGSNDLIRKAIEDKRKDNETISGQ